MSMGKQLETIAENVPKVYEAGKTSGHSEFINMLSNEGKRTAWRNVFEGAKFEGYTFNPAIRPTRLGNVFFNYVGKSLPLGIDFSNAIIAESVTDTAIIPYQTFAYCNYLERIPDMNMPVQYKYTYTYRNCGALKKIDVIRVAETTTYSNTFTSCNDLEDVTIEGVIGNSINFSVCPLNVKSLKNIISALKDFTGESEYSCTITLKSSAFSALEAEGATAEYNGVACTWEELIDNKKWNLTLA